MKIASLINKDGLGRKDGGCCGPLNNLKTDGGCC